VSNKTWADGSYRPKDEPVPEHVPPQRRRKNTKRWCGGKEGREHQPETVRHHQYTQPPFDTRECHWWERWAYANGERVQRKPDTWSCLHAVRCTECGKYLKVFLPKEECPTWQAQQEATQKRSRRAQRLLEEIPDIIEGLREDQRDPNRPNGI
jgi:hypothetical protein